LRLEGVGLEDRPAIVDNSFRRRDELEIGSSEHTNPIVDRFLREHHRHGLQVFGLFTLLLGGQAILFELFGLYDPSAPWLRIAGLVVIAAGVIAVIWLERRAWARMKAFVGKAGPRLRSASISWRSGMTFIFDNGLGLALDQQGPEFSIGASSGGLTDPPLDIGDVVRLRKRRWRMKTVGMVGRRLGPEGARAALDEIRKALDVKQCTASVLERPSHLPLDPQAPAWTTTLTLFDMRWERKADRILNNLDRIKDFLLELRAKYVPVGTTIRESLGRTRGRRRGGRSSEY
jgi:hypothetical protein